MPTKNTSTNQSSIYADVLYPYQQDGAVWLHKTRRAILADQPGLGKTITSLATLELDGLLANPKANILILTPIINAQTTWKDSIERWVKPRYGTRLVDVSKGTANQKHRYFSEAMAEPADGATIVLANHDAIAYGKNGMRIGAIESLTYDAVLIDESHLVLPINDPRKLTQFRQGLHRIKMKEKAIRLAISGTPDRGKLENRYGTLAFLDMKSVGNKWAWLENNFYVSEKRVSRTRTVKMVGELKSRSAWIERDRQTMLRRTKAEVLTQLPPKRYIDVEIELHSEQKIDYFVQQLISERKIAEAMEENQASGEAMVFALRSRQNTACQWNIETHEPVVGGKSAKLEWLLEWLDERGFIHADDFADNSAKVVIASQFSKVLHWLYEELKNVGIVAAILDGSTPERNRVAIQREFQEGALRIVLLSGNMGVGINLDAADDLVMFDSPYDPDKIEQIEDRVHRASNMHQVTIWNLIAKDSIDQAIVEKVTKRYTATRSVMDGSRGIDFARKVMDQLTKEN